MRIKVIFVEEEMGTLKDDVDALVAAATQVQTDVANEGPSSNDNVAQAVTAAVEAEGLAKVYGPDKLQAELEGLGYTVTAPAPAV